MTAGKWDTDRLCYNKEAADSEKSLVDMTKKIYSVAAYFDYEI